MKRAQSITKLVMAAALTAAACSVPSESGTAATPGLEISSDNTRVANGYANSVAGGSAQLYTVATDADVNSTGIPPGPYKNVWGLFLGVADYKNYSDLANPTNDALGLAKTFQEQCGLKDPIILTNEKVTEQNIQNALGQIGRKAGPGDLVVLHFSGHGVALKNGQTNDVSGYMLMQDAASPDKALQSRETLYGFVNMTNLERMMELAGVNSKHKLVILDCCFSGFGAEFEGQAPKGMTRGGMFDTSFAVETMLQDRSLYFLSAGSGGQEVLDISVDFEGYGLLTGYLIQALKSPQEFQINTMTADRNSFVSVTDLASQSQKVIPYRASNTLQGVLNQVASDAKVPAPKLRDLNSYTKEQLAALPPKARRDFEQIQKLGGRLQQPQFLRKNRGTVLLPVRSAAVPTPTAATATPGTPAPTPTMPPTPTPTPNVPSTPVPTFAVSPTPTSVPGTAPFWSQYADDVATHYGDPAYGTQMKGVLRLLYEGTPPKPTKANNDLVRIAADIFARPRIENPVWDQIAVKEGWQLNGLSDKQVIKMREDWRGKYGLNFAAVPYTGYQLSENYAYRFRLANYDNDPLYYYMIAMDEAGMLQWVAPRMLDGQEVNKSWTDNIGNFASGKMPLAAGEVYAFPDNDPNTGAPGFNNVEGTLDQWFFLVVSETRWPELEKALNDSTAISFKHYNSTSPKKTTPVKSAAKLQLRMRAVGRPQTETVSKPPAAEPNLSYITRNEGHYRIMTWNIDVVPPEALKPVLVFPK